MALSLHNERAMRRSAGFTMIEMMFVVVVIAVLAAVAVVAYTKTMNKSRLAEIPSMFGELKSREEAYKAEFGSYLPACTAPSGVTVGGFLEDCDEGDYWPTPLAGKGNKTDASIPPARWQTLRVQIPSAGLYCQYEVVAGPANDDTTIGTTGQKIFLDTAGAYQKPIRAWYYLMAQCDWDGDPSVNATFWQRDDLTELGRDNELR